MLLPSRRLLVVTAFVLLIVTAVALRTPFIRAGMPYFYDEDEAHHYNRVVNMVKRGEFNPQYFLKPSLHFYLRMPVIAAAFISSYRHGELKSVKEIVTRDPFGLADYSFSATPQRIAKWNRAFSVALSVITVMLTVVAGWLFTSSWGLALLAGAIAALSPPLVTGSAVIGVDVVVCVLSIGALSAALWAVKDFSPARLLMCAALCGLATSTKYNVAPIMVLPIVVCIVVGCTTVKTATIALLGPPLFFLLGTPFLLAELPTFLDHIAYESWHYGVAGHVGHEAEPGLDQAMFYTSWFAQSALTIPLFVLALVGFIAALLRRDRESLVLVIFPAIYLGFMIAQRANFTRNMHLMIPFMALLVIVAVYEGVILCKRHWPRYATAPTWVATALLIPLLLLCLGTRRSALTLPESRHEAAQFIEHTIPDGEKVALSGQLQLPATLIRPGTVERIDATTLDLSDLAAKNFRWLVIGPSTPLTDQQRSRLSLQREIPGVAEKQRVVANPAIQIFTIVPSL